MSIKAVIAWLIVALCLGLASLWLLRTDKGLGSSTSGSSASLAIGDRVLEILPSSVIGVSVATPGQPTFTIERAPQGQSPLGMDADWLMRSNPQPAASGTGAASTIPLGRSVPAWPIVPTQMQALLRKITEARAIAIPQQDLLVGPKATTVVLTTSSGTYTLVFADRRLAGSGLVTISSSLDPTKTRRALINDELHAVFTQPGPVAWRETTPLSGIAEAAARLRLENDQQRITLARIEGRWNMIEPVGAPADAAAVQRTLAALGRVQIVNFLDEGLPANAGSTGLDAPIARISVDIDERTLKPGSSETEVKTRTLNIAIGTPLDASGTRVYASINQDTPVVLDAKTLQALSTMPMAYVWPHAIRFQPADIGGISISVPEAADRAAIDRRFRRLDTRWTLIRSGGDEAALADRDQREVENVLNFLTGTSKIGPSVDPSGLAQPGSTGAGAQMSILAPNGYTPIGRLVLSSLAGSPLYDLEFGSVTPETITLKSGNASNTVYRTFPLASTPQLLVDVVMRGRK